MSFIDPQSLARISMTVNTTNKTLDIGVKAPFRMWLPDASNPGSSIEKMISAPSQIKFDTHASENFNTGEMGQDLAAAWGESYPLLWYLTIKSGVVYWVCSRNHVMVAMPSSGNNIGDFDAAPVTSSQNNVFVAASITEADFVDLPVWGPIGGMPVTRVAASAIPTAVALTAGQDGFGYLNKFWGVGWKFPLGQNGAASTSTYQTNASANTCSAEMVYYMQENGGVHIAGRSAWAGAGGAVSVRIAAPFSVSTSGAWFGTALNLSTGVHDFIYEVSGQELAPITVAGANVASNSLTGDTYYYNIIGHPFSN